MGSFVLKKWNLHKSSATPNSAAPTVLHDVLLVASVRVEFTHAPSCLASVFPITATVESYFSQLQWGKDVHSSCLTDLSLEDILHCKQNEYLMKVKYWVSQSTAVI